MIEKLKKIKIAYLVSSFPTISETFIVNQIVDLLERGHEVRIFAFHKNEDAVLHQRIIDNNLLEKTIYFEEFHVSKLWRYFPFLRFLIADYKNVHFLKLLKNFSFKKTGFKTFNLRFFYKYYWILKYGKFDVIHAHFGQNGAYIADIKSKGFLASSKFVTTFHGYDLNPFKLSYYKYNYKKLFEEVDLITVNTKYTGSLLKKITSLDKIRILPVGMDTRIFKKKNIPCKTEFRILFVGRLIELKAPQLALEIYRLLIQRGHKNIGITIIGDGELKEELINSLKEDGTENVKILGALSQEEIIREMELAHVFILPGIYDSTGRAETQGLVIQEAQAMELPVIVSDAGGMKYGLINNETGFVVREKNIGSFADKIEHLITNEEIRKKMGKQGRRFVVENYDSEKLGDQLEEFYALICSY